MCSDSLYTSNSGHCGLTYDYTLLQTETTNITIQIFYVMDKYPYRVSTDQLQCLLVAVNLLSFVGDDYDDPN